MKRFVEGEDRRQGILLPEYLDDYVSADSDEAGRAFRLMSATCSDRSRPAVPIDVGRVADRPLV